MGWVAMPPRVVRDCYGIGLLTRMIVIVRSGGGDEQPDVLEIYLTY